MSANATDVAAAVSPAELPGAMTAINIYRRLAWARIRRGRLKWTALVLLILPVLGTGVLALTGSWGRDLFDNILEIHLRFLVLFLPALATSQTVAEEIENKTFTFIFVRPAPRWAMPIGKYLAAVGPLCVLFVLSVTASFVIALLIPPAGPHELVENLPTLGRALAAVVLGVLVFAAVAAVMGSWFTRHPFVAVMGFLLLIEGLIASLPLIISVVAMSWHLRNLAGVGIAQQSNFVFGEAHLEPWVSAAILVAVAGFALLGAGTSVQGAEYRTDR
jgi:ABC-type transport system involved in multi-copper enzyme maturation permease subunit